MRGRHLDPQRGVALLEQHGALNVAEWSRALGGCKSAGSQLSRRMEAAGLLIRRREGREVKLYPCSGVTVLLRPEHQSRLYRLSDALRRMLAAGAAMRNSSRRLVDYRSAQAQANNQAALARAKTEQLATAEVVAAEIAALAASGVRAGGCRG